MKLYSYIRENIGLRTVEIEISLNPGLPKIQFLGMPDSLIKESVYRIQSALKHQGYKLPKAKQILVQLKPQNLKKTSQGLDLAVAAGILWETGQESKPEVESIGLYGELSLKGEVSVPDDFDDIVETPTFKRFYTGKLEQNSFDLFSIKELKNLKDPTIINGQHTKKPFERPFTPQIKISTAQAEIAKLIAVGEHPVLFAGPPGTGKSTLAYLISTLIRDPELGELKKSQQVWRHFGIDLNWRPIVMPHHSATALAMIGGGVSPQPGEITRAHGGVLLLDELLEFDSRVQEALREPLETGKITISRTGSVMIFPARFLFLATTNLCICGHLIPERKFECQGRPSTCLNYLRKLSGPLLDRFTVLSFSHSWGNPTRKDQASVSTLNLHSQVQKTLEFILKTRNQTLPNHIVDFVELEKTIEPFAKKNLMPTIGESIRRYQSLVRLARTFADLEESPLIKGEHIERARIFAIENFSKLKQIN